MNQPFTISILHGDDHRDWAVEQAYDLKNEIEFKEPDISVRQLETLNPDAASFGLPEAVISFITTTGLVGHVASIIKAWLESRGKELKKKNATVTIESTTSDGSKRVITITDVENPKELLALISAQSN